jgi:hypothetical protein
MNMDQQERLIKRLHEEERLLLLALKKNAPGSPSILRRIINWFKRQFAACKEK